MNELIYLVVNDVNFFNPIFYYSEAWSLLWRDIPASNHDSIPKIYLNEQKNVHSDGYE